MESFQYADSSDPIRPDLAELAANASHVAVDRALVDGVPMAVRTLDQIAPRVDALGTREQRPQQHELRCRQAHLLAIPGATVTLGVQRQCAVAQHAIPCGP